MTCPGSRHRQAATPVAHRPLLAYDTAAGLNHPATYTVATDTVATDTVATGAAATGATTAGARS
jgi:hypothetical protein